MFRTYFSLFLLLLITVPVIDRAVDELGHLEELHCDDSSLHYCQTSHDCPICDYVFSGNASLPNTQISLRLFAAAQVKYGTPVLPETIAVKKSLPLQRGPPSC